MHGFHAVRCTRQVYGWSLWQARVILSPCKPAGLGHPHQYSAPMDQPASVQRLQKSIESMVEDLQRSHLIPRQKEAFLCCARCCDTHASSTQELQGCVERCSMGSMNQQKTIQQLMQDFQERFQRCALRCQDLAREVGGLNPTPAEESKAKDKFMSCMDGCGKEFESKIPRLKQDIIGQLNRT